MRADLVRWTKRLLACAVLAAALAYVPYRVYGSEGYVHYRSLKRQHAALIDGNARLRHENARLRREIRRLRDDLGAIEAVARDELGMVLPGEIVFQIEEPDGVGAAQRVGEALATDPGAAPSTAVDAAARRVTRTVIPTATRTDR